MKILDSEINLDANKALLFKKHWFLFLLVLITAAMDAFSTTVFMERIGPQVEMNPVVRVLSFTYGIKTGPVLGKLYQIFALWVISIMTPRLTRFICVMVILFNCYAFVINLMIEGNI
ncbi:hypothetical protein ACFL6U_27880 [Planctomycetota bacterium]